MYKSLVKYIESSVIWDKVELCFIDVTKVRIEDYPEAFSILKKGYAIPLVSVGGRVIYSGGIPYEDIYVEAVRVISEEYNRVWS